MNNDVSIGSENPLLIKEKSINLPDNTIFNEKITI